MYNNIDSVLVTPDRCMLAAPSTMSPRAALPKTNSTPAHTSHPTPTTTDPALALVRFLEQNNNTFRTQNNINTGEQWNLQVHVNADPPSHHHHHPATPTTTTTAPPLLTRARIRTKSPKPNAISPAIIPVC